MLAKTCLYRSIFLTVFSLVLLFIRLTWISCWLFYSFYRFWPSSVRQVLWRDKLIWAALGNVPPSIFVDIEKRSLFSISSGRALEERNVIVHRIQMVVTAIALLGKATELNFFPFHLPPFLNNSCVKSSDPTDSVLSKKKFSMHCTFYERFCDSSRRALMLNWNEAGCQWADTTVGLICSMFTSGQTASLHLDCTSRILSVTNCRDFSNYLVLQPSQTLSPMPVDIYPILFQYWYFFFFVTYFVFAFVLHRLHCYLILQWKAQHN